MKNKVTRCEKAGCKEVDVSIGKFGIGLRTVRLCDDHSYDWSNDSTARDLGQKTALVRIAVDCHVNMGRTSEAQQAQRELFEQETESRAYIEKWLASIGGNAARTDPMPGRVSSLSQDELNRIATPGSEQ